MLFGNRVALSPGLGGVRDVASAIFSHEQTQSNRVCCFQTLDAVFPKDLFFFRLYRCTKVINHVLQKDHVDNITINKYKKKLLK